MSITAGLSLVQEKGHHYVSHNRRHEKSGDELDVFDAAAYFSGANQMYGASIQHKMMRSGRRMSLDNPTMTANANSISSPTSFRHSKKGEKKYKHPNSPGGKVATFLNSLFNQISSKKKTSHAHSVKTTTDQDPELRRTTKRRSSISHFRNLNTLSSSDSKSSSTTSKFKTPPNVKSHEDHDPNVMVISTHLSKINDINIHVMPFSSSSHEKIYVTEKTENSRLHEEKLKFRTSKKCSNFVNGILGEKTDQSENSTNFVNDETRDGEDSDSSSDLFELQNFDLVSCFSSNSLAYHESTHVDTR